MLFLFLHLISHFRYFCSIYFLAGMSVSLDSLQNHVWIVFKIMVELIMIQKNHDRVEANRNNFTSIKINSIIINQLCKINFFQNQFYHH